jgi:hypothetical protein
MLGCIAFVVLNHIQLLSVDLLCFFDVLIILQAKPNFAELPKYFENLNAVSAVIRQLPLMISETLVCGIPTSLDN